jgi:enterochelin esterase family protein
MPVTVAVFVEPSQNRNAEYDAFDDSYARFLLEEIIPVVRTDYSITDDHENWAIAGGSSGGNCAFTAAWFRSDCFRRVYCASGSFVQMPGGNPYPELIPSRPRMPLRIWLQASTRDLNWDAPEYNWFSSNLQVAAALAERGYDFRLVVGDGSHDGNHGGVLFPDALRWLWRFSGAKPS